MLQNVDAIPERCGEWYTKRLSFKDRPNEYFTVRHRNPIEAIKGLWGDPAFTNDLVYKLAKLFRGAMQTEEEQMFSEMWTGGLWNASQVSLSICFFALIYPTFLKGSYSRGRDHSSSNHCL